MAFDENTVIKAPIHDTNELYTDAELASNYAVTYDKTTGIATITAKNLKYHKNGAGAMGYWIGIGAVIPAETAYEDIMYAWDGGALASAGMTAADFTVDDVEYLGAYVNVAKVTNYRQLSLSFDAGVTRYEYYLNVRNVELSSTVVPDTLSGSWATAYIGTLPASVQTKFAGMQAVERITIDPDGTRPLLSKEVELIQRSR